MYFAILFCVLRYIPLYNSGSLFDHCITAQSRHRHSTEKLKNSVVFCCITAPLYTNVQFIQFKPVIFDISNYALIHALISFQYRLESLHFMCLLEIAPVFGCITGAPFQAANLERTSESKFLCSFVLCSVMNSFKLFKILYVWRRWYVSSKSFLTSSRS